MRIEAKFVEKLQTWLVVTQLWEKACIPRIKEHFDFFYDHLNTDGRSGNRITAFEKVVAGSAKNTYYTAPGFSINRVCQNCPHAEKCKEEHVIQHIELEYPDDPGITYPYDISTQWVEAPMPKRGRYIIANDPTKSWEDLDGKTALDGVKAVPTVYDANLCGWYCKKRNLLLSADFSHQSGAIPLCLKLLDQVEPTRCGEKGICPTKPKMKITYGADPEFEVMDCEEEFTPANEVVDDGCYGEIGTDGRSDTLELRPSPMTTAEDMENEMRRLFKRFAKEYKGYHLSSKGDEVPLGGHVHLGGVPSATGKQFAAILDWVIGRRMIRFSGDSRSGYKKLSQYKNQPHGFEYRSLPAACFSSPTIVRIVYKLVSGAAEKYYNSPEGIGYEETKMATFAEMASLGSLTPKEVDFIRTFKDNYTGLRVLGNWGIRESLPPRHTTEFMDEWDKEVKKIIKKIVMVNNTGKKTKFIFYGWNRGKGRNVVSGFTPSGSFAYKYVTVPHTPKYAEHGKIEGTKCFALPAPFRDGNVAQLSELMGSLERAIRKELRRK